MAYSSLDYDCGEKASLYAAAGIADYWVVDLAGRAIHVFRQPAADGYGEHRVHRLGEELRPLAFPQVPLSMAELFLLG